MSLADELLADLEDDNDEELEELIKKEENHEEEEEMVVDEVEDEINVNVDNVRSICKLRDGEKLNIILKQIDFYIQNPRKASEIGNMESDPEYQLILDANTISLEIDNEICKWLLPKMIRFFIYCSFV